MGKLKGASAPQHTEGEKIALAKQICEVYQSQHCTLESACETVGVSWRTFYLWNAQIAEIAETYKKAKEKSEEHYFEEVLKPKSMRSLEKLIDGCTYTEVRNENGIGASGPISKTVETEITVLPNPTSVIFGMKVVFPERTKDRADVTTNGKDITTDSLANVPIEKQAEILRLLLPKKDADK